ncbi:hypothetical protein OBV_21690 [Oscillibacter valericigenes Sjm18-20]|nr:hypothetical protein OBV_21690 [Oscillibacter valericigenes Sjm18-20]
MPARSARILFLSIIGIIFGLLAWPRAIMIDQTIEITEYSLTDSNYAVPHTVTIKGTYKDSQMLDDSYEGTFSISGIPPTENTVAVINKMSLQGTNMIEYLNIQTQHFSNSEVCDLRCKQGFSSCGLLLMDLEYRSNSIIGTWPGEKSRFIIWPADNRTEALAMFDSMYPGLINLSNSLSNEANS